jgi:hypothetical protein
LPLLVLPQQPDRLRVHREENGEQLARPAQATHLSRWRLAMEKFEPVSERDALLIAARRRGLTMPEVGAEFGITPQRVQQILCRHGEGGNRVDRRRVMTSATCAACGKEFRVKPGTFGCG